MNIKQTFQYISYLQYPLMLFGLYYCIKPYFYLFSENVNKNLMFQDYNNALIFMGLAVSFSTLQDTTKTQNKFSEKIYKNPKKGKIFIIYCLVLTLFFLVLGLIGYFSATENKLKELSFGLIVFGIGLIGMLKAAIEMFENHRIDKNPEKN